MAGSNKVLVLGGSIRANWHNREAVRELGECSVDLGDFAARAAGRIKRGSRLSNSELMAAAALRGAVEFGAQVEYFPLVMLFPPQDKNVFELKDSRISNVLTRVDSLEIDPWKFDELLSSLDQAQGVILSTPVYFGDRSSVANKFLQISAVRGLMKDKVFGMVSVGAKRNGGQETANIFGLYEAISQGALAVGNGPPTSQYGGTAIGGDRGGVLDDSWGLETALGTGKKVARTAAMATLGRTAEPPSTVNIVILVTVDTKERMLFNYLQELVARVEDRLPWVRLTLLELIQHNIYRCLGCRICPSNKEAGGRNAHCIIKDPTDYMEVIRGHLLEADGALVAGLNHLDASQMIFRYQVSTERMRYIRRNDFELSDLLMSGMCYHQFGAVMNPIHSLKTMASYIRHNTIIHRPVDILEHRNSFLLDDGLDSLLAFCASARQLKAGRQLMPELHVKYDPYGKGGGYKQEGAALNLG